MFIMRQVIYNYSLKKNGFNELLTELGIYNYNIISPYMMYVFLNYYINLLPDKQRESMMIKILLLY
jgi:hypothetical protein